MRRPISTPRFIVARSAEELQDLMWAFQLKRQLIVEFYGIQESKGKWYAWFDMPMSRVRDENGETNK